MITILVSLSLIASPGVVQTIAFESSNQTIEAQTYVASTLVNRAKRRNTSLEREAFRPWQYSCNNTGVHLKPRTKTELARARLALEAAISNPKPVTHYFDDSIKPPRWAAKLTFVKKIGRLNFYRNNN